MIEVSVVLLGTLLEPAALVPRETVCPSAVVAFTLYRLSVPVASKVYSQSSRSSSAPLNVAVAVAFTATVFTSGACGSSPVIVTFATFLSSAEVSVLL